MKRLKDAIQEPSSRRHLLDGTKTLKSLNDNGIFVCFHAPPEKAVPATVFIHCIYMPNRLIAEVNMAPIGYTR